MNERKTFSAGQFHNIPAKKVSLHYHVYFARALAKYGGPMNGMDGLLPLSLPLAWSYTYWWRTALPTNQKEGGKYAFFSTRIKITLVHIRRFVEPIENINSYHIFTSFCIFQTNAIVNDSLFALLEDLMLHVAHILLNVISLFRIFFQVNHVVNFIVVDKGCKSGVAILPRVEICSFHDEVVSRRRKESSTRYFSWKHHPHIATSNFIVNGIRWVFGLLHGY
jgi:hypothetical protein